ncbi:hypothetical protein ACTMTI_35415 [Nonomuraea sp. H19]|uniref:hypothetical protein n=1 Tax=Nonomuraea sp. H19 TaxID=3452206 RepID=UPI003F8A367D
MSKRYLVVAAVAAATLVTAAVPANAAPAQPLKFRNGLTIYIPIEWEVRRIGADQVQVITGKCRGTQGWGTYECKAFYLFGPSMIKIGAEGWGAYTGKNPFYTASDVQPCPFNRKWGEHIGPQVKRGLRQVGPGHKAAYNAWSATCVPYDSNKIKGRFTQREWYLPKSKILIVDQWNTPGLSDALKYADWN